MKKTVITTLIVPLLFIVLMSSGRADSPITATGFYETYLDVPIVKRAHVEGVMGLEIAEFLSSPENPIDIKAAVINGLSWRIDGKSNAELYTYYLALLYHLPLKELDIDVLSADEVFCIGYLSIMDDYFYPEKALPFLEKAQEMAKDSFTVSIVLALAKAQMAFNSDWCEAWKLVENVLKNKDLKQDLRPEAAKMIVDYMMLYKEYCK